MCSAWIVDGRRLESGADLVTEFGAEKAAWLNERIEGQSEESWLECCLCHVDQERLCELTGREWRYDLELDAFAAVEAVPG